MDSPKFVAYNMHVAYICSYFPPIRLAPLRFFPNFMIICSNELLLCTYADNIYVWCTMRVNRAN